MHISIDQGFHAPIERLMQQLQTDDPKLAVQHIIGCWLIAQGAAPQPALPTDEPSASEVLFSTPAPAPTPAAPADFVFAEPIEL